MMTGYPISHPANHTTIITMIRLSLAALLLLGLPALHAETKKPAAADTPAKTETTSPPAAPDKKETTKKAPAKAAEKPAAKPAKPAAGAVDPADQVLLDHADKELKKLTPAQNAALLKLGNEGTPEELLTIPGIGETKAAAIKKARPLKSAAQLIMVDGIGEATFNGIVEWVKDGMPKDETTARPAAKKEDKAKTEPAAKAGDKPAGKPAKTAGKAEDKPVPAKK